MTKPIEEWARFVVQHALGVEVQRHDDGSQPSMYDLRVGPTAEPRAAIEVTMAADQAWMEAATLLSGEAIRAPSLTGTWIVDVHPKTRIKDLIGRIEPVLADLETKYSPEQLVDHRGLLPSDVLRVERLGVTEAYRSTMGSCGQIYARLPGQGGLWIGTE